MSIGGSHQTRYEYNAATLPSAHKGAPGNCGSHLELMALLQLAEISHRTYASFRQFPSCHLIVWSTSHAFEYRSVSNSYVTFYAASHNIPNGEPIRPQNLTNWGAALVRIGFQHIPWSQFVRRVGGNRLLPIELLLRTLR